MTFKERLTIEHPDKLNEDCYAGCEGCPDAYGYEGFSTCPQIGDYGAEKCKICWDREIPETENKTEEEKSMRNVRDILEVNVCDSLSASSIKETIENVLEDRDYSDMVDDLVEETVRDELDEYVGKILSDIVKDAVRSVLEDLFN